MYGEFPRKRSVAFFYFLLKANDFFLQGDQDFLANCFVYRAIVCYASFYIGVASVRVGSRCFKIGITVKSLCCPFLHSFHFMLSLF